MQKKGKIKKEVNDELKVLIGGRVQRVRKRLDRSALWVAERIGITRGALTQIERGHNNVSAVQLWKIASVLKCDIKDFFPDVPNSAPLTETDLQIIAEENEQAVGFAKKAFNLK